MVRVNEIVCFCTLGRVLPSRANKRVESLSGVSGIPCWSAHFSSTKFPSAPESIKAAQEADDPAHWRCAGSVVQEVEGIVLVVALASNPPPTGERWLLPDRKTQSERH